MTCVFILTCHLSSLIGEFKWKQKNGTSWCALASNTACRGSESIVTNTLTMKRTDTNIVTMDLVRITFFTTSLFGNFPPINLGLH